MSKPKITGTERFYRDAEGRLHVGYDLFEAKETSGQTNYTPLGSSCLNFLKPPPGTSPVFTDKIDVSVMLKPLRQRAAEMQQRSGTWDEYRLRTAEDITKLENALAEAAIIHQVDKAKTAKLEQLHSINEAEQSHNELLDLAQSAAWSDDDDENTGLVFAVATHLVSIAADCHEYMEAAVDIATSLNVPGYAFSAAGQRLDCGTMKEGAREWRQKAEDLCGTEDDFISYPDIVNRMKALASNGRDGDGQETSMYLPFEALGHGGGGHILPPRLTRDGGNNELPMDDGKAGAAYVVVDAADGSAGLAWAADSLRKDRYERFSAIHHQELGWLVPYTTPRSPAYSAMPSFDPDMSMLGPQESEAQAILRAAGRLMAQMSAARADWQRAEASAASGQFGWLRQLQQTRARVAMCETHQSTLFGYSRRAASRA
ncbi:hypothetical protein Q5752_001961 [Cryptotrichosporon argae]